MFLFPFGEICYAFSFFCFVLAIILAKILSLLFCALFYFGEICYANFLVREYHGEDFTLFFWEYRFPTDDLRRPTTMNDCAK